MLSVCIPVFNVKVSNLVRVLQEQVAKLDVPAEIIVIDDNSDKVYAEENKLVASASVQYIALAENIGRARIRNLFLKYVQYDNLLFLDCDSEVIKADFIASYVTGIKNGDKVICGGRVYSDDTPPRTTRLHWKYGREKESKPAGQRQLNPTASFMTNNFVVARSIFEEIKLDERLNGYGHEDTLFGYELKKKGISIIHINNPVLHAELHSNKVFMENTESALRNLSKIMAFMGNDKAFINDVAILRTYTTLSKYGLVLFVRLGFGFCSSLIRVILCSGFANMFLLNFYKLGYFVNIQKVASV